MALNFSPQLSNSYKELSTNVLFVRGADKSLARPDWKKQLKGSNFSSDAEGIAAAETWLDGQPSDFFLSGFQK
jgi:hypothetical protein